MARETNYDIGDLVRLSATFRDSDRALVDPTEVSATIIDSAGTKVTKIYLTDAEIVRDSIGAFHWDFTPLIAGRHWIRWFSTGTGQAAEELQFNIRTQQTA